MTNDGGTSGKTSRRGFRAQSPPQLLGSRSVSLQSGQNDFPRSPACSTQSRSVISLDFVAVELTSSLSPHFPLQVCPAAVPNRRGSRHCEMSPDLVTDVNGLHAVRVSCALYARQAAAASLPRRTSRTPERHSIQSRRQFHSNFAMFHTRYSNRINVPYEAGLLGVSRG